MRKEIVLFADKMEEKLKIKDEIYGDSWKTMNISDLLLRLKQEWNEFTDEVWMNDRGGAMKCDYPESELLDIANLCMMLYLRQAPAPTQTKDGG